MPLLKNTSLCVIVGDEMINPAGGIQSFLDTGSIDGTRQVLKDTRKSYPHLRVFDHPFQGWYRE